MEEIPNLSDYKVSETHGFLLPDPLESLPEYFHPWESAAKNIANLLIDRQLRDLINEMPLLDHTRLSSYNEQRLAQLFLTFLGNGYVWQDGTEGVAKVLPKQVSVPLCALCKILGGQPCLGHMAQALANYTLKDPTGPLHMSNMNVVVALHDVQNHEWVTLVTIQAEIEGIPGTKAAIEALKATKRQDKDGLTSALQTMTASAKNMKEALALFHQNLDAKTFYNVVLSYMVGWPGPSSTLPNGLIYEGVSDTPKEVLGYSAAQSSLMYTYDAVLGITHNPEVQTHLDDLLNYMPIPHKDFVLALRKCGPVKSFVETVGDESLTSAFNDCMTACQEFRSYHIQIVTKYVVTQAKTSASDSGDDEVLPYLKKLRDETIAAKIL